jgi:hypothetical protein
MLQFNLNRSDINVYTGKGTIVFHNEKKRQGGIHCDNGALYHFGPDTKILGNRIPKEGDEVGFSYKKRQVNLVGIDESIKVLTLIVAKQL